MKLTMTKEDIIGNIKTRISCIESYSPEELALNQGVLHELKDLLAMIEKDEPSLPSNLDEAVEQIASDIVPTYPDIDWDDCFERIKEGVKAGAEWMAGQGVKATATVGYYNQSGLSILTEPSIKKLGFKEGDELEIIIRKK